MIQTPWNPRRILVGYNLHRRLGEYIASRRPDLQVRGKDTGEITTDDLEWAEVYVGFRRPPRAASLGAVRWVHCVGAGVDGFLFPDPLPGDVLLTRTSELFGPQIGEYCLARALAATQHIPELAEVQRERRWAPRHVKTLRGGRVLVVGTGEVGCGVASAFQCMGCEVHGVSRTGAPQPPFQSVGPTAALGDMVGAADWLVLAVPLTAESYHLIDRRILRACQGAFLINVGRGALVDERALPEALDAGWLRGAALDVFETEPLPADSPLWARRDIMISPHVAGLTTITGAGDGFLECLASLERGEWPKWVVDKARGY